MPKIKLTDSLVCEYLINEAGSGDIPLFVLDNIGPNDLVLDWGLGNGSWITDASGRGVDFADPVRQSNSNIIYQDGNVTAIGDIGPRFGNAVQKACIHLVADIRVGHGSIMRLVSVASTSGNTVVSIHADVAAIEGRWNSEDGQLKRWASSEGAPGSGIHAYSMYVDTTQPNDIDKVKLYVDGVQVPFPQIGQEIVQDETCDINRDHLFFTIGNRPSQNRNPEADIHYVALRNDTDDEGDVAEIHALLLANNDESPFEPGEPPEPGDDLLFLGTQPVDAVKLGDSDVDAIFHGTTQVYP